MANRECNGNFFEVDGVSYYRCFLDGKLILRKDLIKSSCPTCPRCHRPMNGKERGVVEVRTYKYAMVPIWGDFNNKVAIQLPTEENKGFK